MGKLFSILVMVMIVWQVINGIIESAAKRKEQERLRQLSKRRATGAEGGPPRQTGGPQQARMRSESAAPASQRTRSRAEELAARRQAQLEELRKRRAGQGRAPKSATAGRTQVRIGQPGGPASGRPGSIGSPQQRPGELIGQGADFEAQRRAREAERRRREQLEARRREEARAAEQAEARRKALAEARAKASREAFHRRAEAGVVQLRGKPSVARPERGAGAPVQPSAVKRRLKDRAMLRELFVMKELIDPPVALRDPTA